MFFVFITKNERNEYSYISFSGFFFAFCFYTLYTLIFDFLRFDFFQVQFISFVKRKAKTTIQQKKGIGHEKRDRFRSGF